MIVLLTFTRWTLW